ncbi:MAG: DUF1259 domain-containing protein, partial [Verrucomicrobia bacterium]|nr:DUF1259 domain-containing protein [Verrucomicrobiota bacterium]
MKTVATRCLHAAASATALMLGWTGAVCAQSSASSRLPVGQIEQIIGIQGDVENGVLHLEVQRDDIGNVKGPMGPLKPGGPQVAQVTFDGAFEINGDIFFQPLFGELAFLNADQALKEAELQPFIFTLLQHGLVFQAFHQHLPMHPQVWFVHYRGIGNAIALAQAIRAAINVTSTPLPQAPPSNPTTPLDVNMLKTILHADQVSVGDKGVVT